MGSDCKLRVLEMLLNISEELFCVGAVDDAMIEAEREVRQVANRYVIFTIGRRENSGPFFDLAHTEDRYLRLVDDRGAEESTEHTGISNRERAAANLVRLELFCARAIGEIVCRPS